MSHEITQRDGLFTVRRPAWHGLGTVLADYPTREEAQAIAHPWEPIAEPVYRRVPQIVAGPHDSTCEPDCEDSHEDVVTTYEEVEGFSARVRDDDGYTLGVLPDSLPVIQNEEMYDIAEALQGEGAQVKFETGGSLKGGKKVWLLLRFNEPLRIKGRHGTEVIPYYALQNDHSGKGAFRGQATMTAIVCDNTSLMADLDAQARGTEFVFRHTTNVQERIDEAKIALAGWQSSVEEWQRYSDYMFGVPVDKVQIGEFIRQFLPMPPPHMSSERVENNVRAARQTLLGILKSETCAATLGTAYGLVEAAVEYNQHFRKARTAETRFQRAYLDKSKVTADAVTIVKELIRA